MSNINGDKHEDSIFRNGAQLNGDPIYLMSGENHNDNDDVREALDVILPKENVHSHVDRQNGQESVYEEPLQESAYEEPLLSESESDYDYPQSNQLVEGNGDGNVLFVPNEYADTENDYANEIGEDSLNEQAKEEAFEDYYDQLLKNVVWKKNPLQRFWLFAGNKPKIEFSVPLFQK